MMQIVKRHSLKRILKLSREHKLAMSLEPRFAFRTNMSFPCPSRRRLLLETMLKVYPYTESGSMSFVLTQVGVSNILRIYLVEPTE